MENEIKSKEKAYKIALVGFLITFTDAIITPIIMGYFQTDWGDYGLIVFVFTLVGGKTTGYIGFWITNTWFIWGIIAAVTKRRINKLKQDTSK